MPNRNLTNLAMIYDFANQELDRVIKAGLPLADVGVLKKLNLIHEAAKAMSLVYQIENLRREHTEDKVALPEEQEVEDPASVAAKKNNFNSSSGLDSHKGWKPF